MLISFSFPAPQLSALWLVVLHWHSDLSPHPSACLTEAWQQSCMHPHTLQALQPQAYKNQSGVPRSWSNLFLTGRSRDPSDHVVSNSFFLSLIAGSHAPYLTHLFVQSGVCYHSNVQPHNRELAHIQGLEKNFVKLQNTLKWKSTELSQKTVHMILYFLPAEWHLFLASTEVIFKVPSNPNYSISLQLVDVTSRAIG